MSTGEQIWAEVNEIDEATWRAKISEFRATYERIKGHLDNADDWHDTHELSCMLGILMHSAYHLGEIRQMMCRLES